MKFLRLFTALLAVPAVLRADEIETIVCLRHGEKPAVEFGQLSARGFNRALALADVLLKRFGQPRYIFAPDPALDPIGPPGRPLFDYLRPLATIEPTAIRCGLPVNTSFGYTNTEALENELRKPEYHRAVIFVCWEQVGLGEFIASFAADVGGTPLQDIEWPAPDFDSLYILKVRYGKAGTIVSVTHEREGLDGLSDRYPAVGQ